MADISTNASAAIVDTVLQRAVDVHEQTSCGQWLVCVPQTHKKAKIELQADWLTFDVTLPALRKELDYERIGAMLQRNASIKGCPRIVGDRLGRRRHLAAEIPLDLLPWDSEADIEALITTTIDAVAANFRKNLCAPDTSTPSPPTSAELAGLLEEAGWPSVSGDSDSIEVLLHLPGDFVAASVQHNDGLTRLSVAVLPKEFGSAQHDCRRAVTVLLWLTASRIRMVRPVRYRRMLSLEVRLSERCLSASGLKHGFAALSIAAQQLIAEARLLIDDERLAKVYLSNLGFKAAK